MRPPPSNLPPLSEPWARYVQDQADEADRKLDDYELGISSQSSTNGGIMQRMGAQIKSFDAAAITIVTVDNFSRTVPPTPIGDTPQYAFSPIVSASMPTGGVANSCRLIVNFDVTDDKDTTIADRGELFVRLNTQYGKDPRTAGPVGAGLIPYVGARSSMMLSTEQTTSYDAQFCMRVASYNISGVLTFSNVKFTYIFYGAI